MRTTAPERMSRGDILAEVGELLAAGIQRFLATKCDGSNLADIAADPLDDDGDVEAPCVPTKESIE